MSTATAPKPLAALLVAHAQLVPSLTNPRKRFDKDRLEELALSMAPPVGILEPLVVRPLKDVTRITAAERGGGPFYEIIAGERRWRAAAIAKLTEIPIVIREIADDQVIKLQLVENKNREDIHPLDEAEAMERLLKINKAETPKTIAATIGMSERYVQNRLHYLRLVPEVKEAFRTEAITAGHVDLLMRLPADEQKRAFKEGCFADKFEWDDETDKQTKRTDLVSVRALDEWIKGHVRLSVTDARAPEMELFPELAEAITAATVDSAPKLLELVASNWVDPKIKPAPLTTQSYAVVKKGEKCEHQARGVIVIGQKRGQIRTVCIGVGKCKVHWSHTIRASAPPTSRGSASTRRPQAAIDKEKRENADRAREQQLAKLRGDVIKAGIAQAKKSAPNKPTPALLKLYGFGSWREMAVDRLEELTPFGPVYKGEFLDAKDELARFGVKLDEPKLPESKKAQAAKTGNGSKGGNIRAGATKKAAPKRKAGAKK